MFCPFRVRHARRQDSRDTARCKVHAVGGGASVTPNTLTRYASFCRANWSSIVV